MNILTRYVSRDYLRNGKLNIQGGGSYQSVVSSYDGGTSGNAVIYDGLDSVAVDVALSANQGRVLKELIDENKTQSDDLQEQIDANLQYTKDNFLNKKNEDTAEKLIHFMEGIDAQGISTFEDVTLLGDLLSSNFVKDSNGFGIYLDDEGKYHLDIDSLNVRGRFTTEILEVKESKHIGGKFYCTKAGMVCSKVEEYDTYYRCYFNTTDSDGRTINNQFGVNDQAFMQTFNMSIQTNGKTGNRRFWRLVEAIGENYIDLSKTDCEAGSDVPLAGDSIVQLGNRSYSERQGALIIEPLSMKVYKGIKNYVLPTPFINLNPDKSVIEAQLINAATGEDINDTINGINNRLSQVKEQSDKCFTIWMDDYIPTLDNQPASDWTTNDLKNDHLQDIFYNTSKETGTGGRAYRFELNDNTYSWVEITDKDTIAALEQARKAEDLADSKRRVFVSQPTRTSIYDVGDIWVNANYNDGTTIYKNDELVCIQSKTSGTSFSISHWQPTSTATTAYIENLGNQITQAVTDSEEGIDAAKKLAQKGIDNASTALEKANSAFTLANSANNKATESTTVIQQNKDSIAALANKISFDGSGNVTNISTSGLVTTAKYATLFSEQVTANNLVKRADISTFITEDEAGTLVSNATINADKINFIGKTTINGNFVVDNSGNVTMNNLTANNGVFNGVLEVDSIYYKLSDSTSLTNNCFVFKQGEYRLPSIKSGMATEIRVFVYNPSRTATLLTFTRSGTDQIMTVGDDNTFGSSTSVSLEPNIFYRFIGCNYGSGGVWVIEKNENIV